MLSNKKFFIEVAIQEIEEEYEKAYLSMVGLSPISKDKIGFEKRQLVHDLTNIAERVGIFSKFIEGDYSDETYLQELKTLKNEQSKKVISRSKQEII